ncbi:hypothetical protein ACH427_21105 [Streptomyces sp. NPDC020379]|uniref:hypothetical protein n=1 Tax=Streptomyces sp. NPDC020379 TaxID=3365071 RepID=UPI0037BA6BC9
MKRKVLLGVSRTVWAEIEIEIDIPEELVDDDHIHDCAGLHELVMRNREAWKDLPPKQQTVDEDALVELFVN